MENQNTKTQRRKKTENSVQNKVQNTPVTVTHGGRRRSKQNRLDRGVEVQGKATGLCRTAGRQETMVMLLEKVVSGGQLEWRTSEDKLSSEDSRVLGSEGSATLRRKGSAALSSGDPGAWSSSGS